MNNLVLKEQILNDDAIVNRLTRLAEMMSCAKTMVPDGIRGNVGDCFLVCVQAQAWGMTPFAVAQKTFTVKGKMGFEAQLISAVITRHALTGKPRFDYGGSWEKVLGKFTIKNNNGKDFTAIGWKPQDEEGLYVDISATLNGETEPRTMRVFLNQAHPRQSSIWATDPKQQLAYTAIKKFARLHCPECILGVQDKDDLSTVTEKDITPKEKLAKILHGQSLTARTESDQPPARPETGQYIEDKQELTPVEVIEAAPVADKGEAMKQRVREKLRDDGQVVDTGPNEQDAINLDMAIQCLKSSQTMAELDEAGQVIKDVLHADHRGQARKVYREMKEVLA